ncbi:MAG: hypothetical protein WAT81_00095 [Candidatus Moraniibacteriota bacterium]
MDTPQVLRVIRIINIIAVICFAPIGLFVFMYAISGIIRTDFGDQMVILGAGYLVATVAGLLAFKKPFWLAVSFGGWLFVWWGQFVYVDKGQQESDNQTLCQMLRQEPGCVEDSTGNMRCNSESFQGSYPAVCSQVRR